MGNSLHLLARAIAALGIVAVSFLVALWAMDYFSPLCPQGTGTALPRPFAKFDPLGFAYVGAAPTFDGLSDSSDNSTRSTLLVCENNRRLGPMHSLHAEIAKEGLGRFSHWQGAGFIFSASDNTDPNRNGRNYWVVKPRS
jgi:hypothetical protein